MEAGIASRRTGKNDVLLIELVVRTPRVMHANVSAHGRVGSDGDEQKGGEFGVHGDNLQEHKGGEISAARAHLIPNLDFSSWWNFI